MNIVSKWYVTKALLILDEVPSYDDPTLEKLINNDESLLERAKPITFYLDLDEVQVLRPQISARSNLTFVKFRNGHANILEANVETVYEVLLKREEYLEQSYRKLMAALIEKANINSNKNGE